MRVVTYALGLAAGGVLLVALGTAAVSGSVPWPVVVVGALALAGGAWRPAEMLPALIVIAPWGARLARVPVRATELVMFAFVAGLLLGWRQPVGATDSTSPRPIGLPRALWAPCCFAAVVIVSWLRTESALPLAAGSATRVLDLLRPVPADYLVTAGRAPHTAAALQALLGVAVFAAVWALARRHAAFIRQALVGIAASGLVTATASVVAVPAIYWATGDYNEIERYIGATPSRGSFHLQDVNAAASHYILSGVIALGLIPTVRRARWAWYAGLLMLVAALWMSGSRAASVAGVATATVWMGARWLGERGWRLPRVAPHRVGLAALVALVAMTASVRLGSAGAETGSASRSLSVRRDFLDTSLRMVATAPIAGVGVGTYYERSTTFMPPALRALYGRENAHHYFMQVLAELGVVGLCAFLWWLASGLAPGIRAAVGRLPSAPFATCLACGAYLLTCITGHPFLVVEAAVPFWAALGVVASMKAE